MNDKTYSKQSLWAHTHGELEAESMKGLEHAAASDGTLQSELNELQRAHKTLQELLPAMDQSDDVLVNEILGAFDNEQVGEVSTTPENEKSPGKIIHFPWPLAAAVAACFAIFIGIQAASSSLLAWNSPDLIELHVRGDMDTYSEKELRTVAKTLMGSGDRAYRKAQANPDPEGPAVKQGWKMDLKDEEIRTGTLDVMVQATTEDPEWTLEWHELIEGRNTVPQQLRQFADEIAAQLAAYPAQSP